MENSHNTTIQYESQNNLSRVVQNQSMTSLKVPYTRNSPSPTGMTGTTVSEQKNNSPYPQPIQDQSRYLSPKPLIKTSPYVTLSKRNEVNDFLLKKRELAK
jgi:hypothetical protein